MVEPDLDVNSLNEDSLKNAIVISLHCMLNGPVGVNKDTTFPSLGNGSIKSLVTPRVTNRTWKNTVRQLAEHVKRQPDWRPIIGASQQFKLHGGLWPLWERELKAK
jgi:hypothetical protein